MTNLTTLKLPLLIIAPDGWLEWVERQSVLSNWNARGIRKYSRIGLYVIDGNGDAWSLNSIQWGNGIPVARRFIARLFGRKLPTVAQMDRLEEPGLRLALRELPKVIDDDDDCITQFASARTIKRAIAKAENLAALVDALKRYNAVLVRD